MSTAPTTALAPINPTTMPQRIMERVPAYVSARPDLLATTGAIQTITGPDDVELALTYARDLQAEAKAAKEHYDPYNQAAHDLRNRLASLRDGVLAKYKDELDRIKALTMRYQQEQERIRREAEAKAAAEARRKQQEEQERIRREAEEVAHKLREEQAQRDRDALARAAELEKTDRAAAAAELERAEREAEVNRQAEAEIMAQAESEAQEVVAEPIILPPTPEPVKVAGTSGRKKFIPVYGDKLNLIAAAAQNPMAYAQYLAFDEKAIGAAVRAQGMAFKCPGVDVEEETGMTIRASR